MRSQNPVEAYISAFPKEVQTALQKIRRTIQVTARGTNEVINYGIPTFQLNGKNVVHFAGYKHHIGFYPTPSAIIAFQKELSPYKQAKGSVQFPLDQPIPFDLINKMVKFRLKTLQKTSK